MPARKASLAITERYRAGMVRIRNRAQAEARRVWGQINHQDFDGSYQVGMLALSVSVLQREAARLSGGYLQAFIQSELGRPVEYPIVDARQVGYSRNGDALRKTLISPLIGVKTGVKEGKDVGRALTEGRHALERIVGLATDTAAREALRAAMQESSYVVGYRRAVKGTCGACMGDTTYEAFSENAPVTPLNIHPNCECVAEPSIRAEPYQPSKGEKIEIRNARELVDGRWSPLGEPVSGKVEKFDHTSVMLNAGTARNPRWVTARLEDAYKPPRAGTRPIDDLPHSINPYRATLTDAEEKFIDSYKGYGYKQINGALRSGKSPGKTAKGLDGLLQKGSLGQDTTLYRFMNLPEGIHGVGDVFRDKAFVSTALKRGALKRGDKSKVLMRIRGKRGQRGGFLPGQNEDEFLLPRDLRFEITKEMVERDGRRVFDVEIVG